MSGSLKGVLTVMALMLPVVMIAGMNNPKMLVWFMGIYVVLGVVGALVAMMADKKKKAKAEKFAEDVEGNSSVQGASKSVEDQQRMDDLRQEFQRGLEIYSQYGKDLYSLPWYVVVGEAGSGKTEMIRRSEIGFPDKLQSFWQGSGGTMSMHWWFTNHAVIIDTAGRLFLKDSDDQGQADDGSEKLWKEFLQMLTKNRSDCPINGLCLVIPASSLAGQADPTADQASYREIDQKAGQISRQMEVLRSELGVRFPVYIIVTKTDLVVGFREFFDAIEKPEERYQMIGWSNPDPLDQPVRAKVVGDHLRDVAERLRKRRMAIMKDPVPKSRMKTQLETVDSLFEFPKSLEAMAPKLERYLQHVFGQDQWSGDPPFLRGVYFTSSLQQGGVLDGAMAAALGIDVDEYQLQEQNEDLSLSKNKTFFLRDLFVDKVFHEKGLVVRRGKSPSKLRGWKFWFPVTLVAALMLFLGLGFLTGMSKPAELKRWETLNDEYYRSETQGFAGLIEEKGDSWKWSSDHIEMLETLEGLGASDLDGPPKMGWLFGIATRMDGGIQEDRKEAYRVAVDGMILRPLKTALVERLENRSPGWAENGLDRADERAIRGLLGLYDGSDHDSLRKELAASFSYIDLKLPGGKRGKAKDITLPLLESVKAAYPDGVKLSSLMTDDDKAALVLIFDEVFSVGGDKGLYKELKEFDGLWAELADLGANELDDQLDKIDSASGRLIPLQARIQELTDGEKEAADEDEEDSFPTSLINDFLETLEAIGPKEIEKWEASTSEDSSLEEQQQAELTEWAALYRSHEELSKLARGWVQFDFEGVAKPFNPTKLNQVKSLRLEIENSLKMAKAFKVDEALANRLLLIGCERYLETTFVEKVSFPLLDTNNRKGRLPLNAREAGAMTLMVKFLTEKLGDRTPAKLTSVYQVGINLFDEDALAEDRIQPKRWRVHASTGDLSYSAKVIIQQVAKDGSATPHDLTPQLGSASEITAKSDVLLPVDAKLTVKNFDIDDEGQVMLAPEKARDWEMVWWFVNGAIATGDGKFGRRFTNPSGGDGSQYVYIWVAKPETWPASLMLLDDFMKTE